MTHVAIFVGIVLVALAGASPVAKDSPAIVETQSADPKNYRLPTDIEPLSYKIHLEPHLEGNFTFDGTSEIQFKVVNDTKVIVLHANDSLTIKSAQLFTSNGTKLGLSDPVKADPVTEILTIHPLSELIANTYTLKLNFTGILNDDLKGFYRSQYKDDYGVTRWIATTQFEPTYARRAFPCWDEPQLKATFNISIKHSKKFTAISNMHDISSSSDSDDYSKRTTTYATTPNMSTYLVAFVVSDYEAISSDKGFFNIWARPNAIRHGAFSLDIGAKALKALDTYTAKSHASIGFKKMDSIAIPQFEAGAMENWGLVTYREALLLVEENVTTTAAKERVATVISHEFAHQWFGNLVSPKWWKYTWLNEGFANYFQYVITDQILPKWRLRDLQVIEALQNAAFAGDSVSTAVEMNYDVVSQSEIKSKFNSTSYQKAGSVIRMISHVVGETNFQIALQKYLNKMAFKSAMSDDLFEEFVQFFPTLSTAGLKAIDILNNWANTPGFPTITVTRNYKSGTVNITQQRYLYKPDDAHNETYYVPINFAKDKKDFNNTKATSWLEKGKSVDNLNVAVNENKWIIFNNQHFGYYRVNYDEGNWKLITDFLKTSHYTDIHVLNRGQLVDDALNLARIGQLKYSVALDLMHFLEKDFDYVPWYSALTGLSFLQRTLRTGAYYHRFEEYLRKLLEPVFNDVKFYESPEDDHLRKLLRVVIIDRACTVGLKSCRDQATKNLTMWMQDSKANRIAPDLKSVILCAAVRDANAKTWDELYAKYMASEENSLQNALGCSSDAAILKKYLTKALDKSVNSTTRDAIFNSVTINTANGVNVALDFVLANADAIYAVSENNTDALKKYITAIGYRITTKEKLDMLKASSNQYVKQVFADGSNGAQETIAWVAKYESQFTEYFKAPEKNSSTEAALSSILIILSFVCSQFY